MDERRRDEGLDVPAESSTIVVRRRPLWARVSSYLAMALLAVLVVAIAVVWVERRTIAGRVLQGEFKRRGVRATYHLDRVGLRTQEVHDLVIGDPAYPDLIAKHAIIQMRLKWDGGFDVYRIYARGVRLRGRL